MKTDFEIIVVANKHREPLVVPFLQAYKHTISMSADYTLPVGFAPDPAYKEYTEYLQGRQLGHYRAWCGHQDALKLAKTNLVLMLEDDAVPFPGWHEVVEKCLPYLGTYEVISLHGRGFDLQEFKRQQEIMPGRSIYKSNVPDAIVKIVRGSSLAYLIKGKRAMNRLINKTYSGMPIDLYLATDFRFGLVGHSPFAHGDKESNSQSILEKAV